ncbi:mycofactocin system transcriptional regulator [Citricoccus sp. GCM10030269]|uniref:mycofactocin system transcriptional regulator n=1 Tax=Citricoccus sp. GCM10030269 TaxID=3273388 RepID=UPI0036124400
MANPNEDEGSERVLGRPRVTTHDRLAEVGVDLFTRLGYANVSVEQIAEAAGVSRRTFFRYFPSKSDLPWGDFEKEVARLRSELARVRDDVPLMVALRHAVVEFNRVPAAGIDDHRARLTLILTEPELIARSQVKYQHWREAVAEFVGRRLDHPTDSFLPQLVGEVALGAAVAAYRQWLPSHSADLPAFMDAAFEAITNLDSLEGVETGDGGQRPSLPHG